MARIRSVQQLRQGLGDAASDYTDEELVQAWAVATGKPLPAMASRMGLDTPSGSTVDFGTTTPGSPVSQVFTIHNTGAGNLNLTPLAADDLPEGFEQQWNVFFVDPDPGVDHINTDKASGGLWILIGINPNDN